MVKERMRAIYNTLPFQKIPARLVIEMAKTAVFWLNAFPVTGGASQDLSPHTILMGQQVDYKHHCHFQFGEYTQTHEEHNNSMNPRTVGAIALRPVGNGQESFYFLSIATGRVLNRLHATALPMPDDVIDKLHRMARQQKNNPGLVFADRNLNPDEYDDDEDDSSRDDDEEVLNYDEEEDNDVDEDEEEAHGPPAGENEAAPGPPVVDNDDDVNGDNNDGDAAGEVDVQQPAEPEQPGNPANQGGHDDDAAFPEIQGVDEEVIEPETPGVGMVEENEEGNNMEDQPAEDVATGQPPPALPQGNNGAEGRYNLRNNRNCNYGHRYAGEDFILDNVAMTTHGTGEVLETPQMSLKAGL